MKALKQIGIFMDHAHAHIMKYDGGEVHSSTVEKQNIDLGERHNSDMSEYRINTKQDIRQKTFYETLGKVIQNNDEVLIFGPTQAKAELVHILHNDPHYSHIKIELKNSDKLTENQQQAFVRDYFKK